jgi:hypothetical protein
MLPFKHRSSLAFKWASLETLHQTKGKVSFVEKKKLALEDLERIYFIHELASLAHILNE